VVGFFFGKMDDTITAGFDVLSEYTETTAVFGSTTVNCIEGETETIADMIMGGLDKVIDGVLLIKKTELTEKPVNGSTFIADDKIFMVETVKSDRYDPIWNVAYSYVKESS